MQNNFDLVLAEMLAARLCHELVSPVGAVANGVEILEEEPEFAEDATKLIADSSRTVTQRLRFYREAYGARDTGDARARTAALEMFAGGKIDADWPETLGQTSAGLQKLACNMLLVASEALPRGGRVALVEPGPDAILKVEASGVGAAIETLAGYLTGPISVEQLTPRTVQAIFTRKLAESLDLVFLLKDDGTGAIEITAVSAIIK